MQGIRDAYYPLAYLAPDYTTPNPAFNVAEYVDFTNRVPNINPATIKPNDYDWYGEGTRSGNIANTNLSISGGNDTFTYLISGSYTKQRGIIINDEFERKTVRANIETKALPFWKIGMQTSGSFTKLDGQEPNLATLFNMSPLLVPYDENGNLIVSPANTVVDLNPFITYQVDDKDRNQYFFANFYSDLNIPFIKGLNYRINYGNNYNTSQRYNASKFAANQLGEAYKNNNSRYDYTFDNILTYKRNFGKHDIQATFLYGAIGRQFEETSARATGYPNLTLGYNDLALGTNQFVTSGGNGSQLNYQMARVFYKFADKYLITATVRRDGFSGFSKNFKNAVFPSLGLGWVVSSEDFWKNTVQVVEYFKLRASLGESGNQTGAYSTIPRVGAGAAYVFGDGGTTQFGQSITSLGNDNLKWERTRELNLGMDFAMFNGRLSGNFDYYLKNTTNLLYGIQIPQVSGFGSIQSNIGRLQNWGIETALTGRIVESKDFRYTSTVNFSLNKNKVVSVLGIDGNGDGIEDDLVQSGLFIGRPISQLFDYQRNGIYNLTEPRLPGFPVGTLKVVDYNNDGTIDAKDRQFLGMTDPRFRISMMNNFVYKRFTLTVMLNSIWGGRDSYQGNNLAQYYRDDQSIRRNDFAGIDYWSPSNPGGKYPRNISGTGARQTPPYFEDRSFVRIQDVSLGYNFAGGLLKKINAQSISLYVSGKNLHTFTNWQGWDPETGQGMVQNGRPVFRSFTFGLNVSY